MAYRVVVDEVSDVDPAVWAKLAAECDAVYRERARLVAALSRHPDEDTEWEDD